MINLTRAVFQYWAGPKPSLITLLHQLTYWNSIASGKYNACMLTPENVHEYIEIPSNFFRLSVVHQADYVRIATVNKYGGIWLDSDIIPLDDLSVLFDYLDRGEGFLVLENNNILCNGVFGSRPNTPFMRAWFKGANEKLSIPEKDLEWGDFGTKLIYEVLDSTPNLLGDYTQLKGLDTIYPSNWDKCVDDYLEKDASQAFRLERDFQPLVILVNSVYREVENCSVNELIGANTCLGAFLRKSIANLCHEQWQSQSTAKRIIA